MISYIKGLFSKKEQISEAVEGMVIEPPKDISEPVISFVECVKNNPRRFGFKFKVTQGTGMYSWEEYTYYFITDKIENITWKVKVISSGYGKDGYSCDTYFTQDEKDLLWEVFTDYFGNQAKMKRDLHLKRGMVRRDRLKAVYCKGGV